MVSTIFSMMRVPSDGAMARYFTLLIAACIFPFAAGNARSQPKMAIGIGTVYGFVSAFFCPDIRPKKRAIRIEGIIALC
jgi:hypothetical protein